MQCQSLNTVDVAVVGVCHTSWGSHISQPIEDRIGLGTTQQMMPGFKHTFKHFAPIEPPVKDNQSTGNVSAYPLQDGVAAIPCFVLGHIRFTQTGNSIVSVTVLQSKPNAPN